MCERAEPCGRAQVKAADLAARLMSTKWAISSAHLPVCTATTSCTEQSAEQCQSLQYVDPDCPTCNGMDYPCVILQGPDGMTQTCQPAGTQPDPSNPTQMMEVLSRDMICFMQN